MKTGSDHFAVATYFRKDVLTLVKEDNTKSHSKLPIHRLKNPAVKTAYLEQLRKLWENEERQQYDSVQTRCTEYLRIVQQAATVLKLPHLHRQSLPPIVI